ncbi:MAG: MotA/TolQ/ExbB proton channel family protein [Phycisphaerales bacterium]|nr:MotA/TolQ/ExbB proton channel family protein [Phycisphaerales bacterium]
MPVTTLLLVPLIAAPALATSSAPGVRTSLFEAFFIQRNPATREIELLGSLIIWFLLALSAVCIGLLGNMLIQNRREDILPERLHQEMGTLFRDRRLKEALARASESDSYYARVLHAALAEASHGYVAMVRAGEQAAEELLLKRIRRIEPLSIVGNVAPMIGLFGTVYGMILAFREIVAAGGSPDPVSLASGIGTALTTTFWGLVVAIPALAGHALMRNWIDGVTLEASRAVEEHINCFRPAGAAAEKVAAEPEPAASDT